MSREKYLLKKIMTDFVGVNIVINGIFYIVNFRKFSGQLTFNDITNDLFVGLLLLGGACSLIGFINIRKELLKEKIDVSQFQTSRLHSMLPKALGLRVLFLAAMTAVITAVLFIAAPKLLGIDQINHIIGFAFKTITAGIMACIIGYIVIDLSISDYQQSHVTVKETRAI